MWCIVFGNQHMAASSIDDFQKRYTTLGDPVAFSGITNISRELGEKEKEVKSKLDTIFSYSLHREYKKPKHQNPFFIYFAREQIQIDLIDVSALQEWNDGIKFLLAVIDCFTKKAWIYPMTSKHGVKTKEALIKLLAEMGNKPHTMFFDRGREFVNENVRSFLRARNIKILHPNSAEKAAIVERFNRSIQSLLYKFLTERQTYRYIDKLQQILSTYNNRGHRTLKYMSPNEAEKDKNWNYVRNMLSEYYTKFTSLKKKKAKFAVGDVVRIKIAKTKFGRGYHEQFKRELFQVTRINKRMPIITYSIKSMNDGEEIKGSFYSNELQAQKGDVFKVEKVIKRRKRNGVDQIYVKWLDFNDTHNQWINATNVTEVY
jgi:hypothetical protein